MKHKLTFIFLLTALIMNSSCGSALYVDSQVYRDFDVAASLGIEFPAQSFDFGELAEPALETEPSEENYVGDEYRSFDMRVVDRMSIYANIGDKNPIETLYAGEVVTLTETEDPDWVRISDSSGKQIGFTNEGFLKAIDASCEVYAELPIEYGSARTNENTYVDAYSHLVDISKYLKVYYSTDIDNTGVDLSQYDVKVSMKLSTSDTTIGEPFYNRNLCMLQYDTLQKLMLAIEKFREDGYTIVIYDAYRPTSVQQRWFDVVQVHKWVANPAIGMGGVHDRGTAIDMSLIDSEGNELEMPTPMHRRICADKHDNDRNRAQQYELYAQCHGLLRLHIYQLGVVAFSGYRHQILPTDRPSD